MSTASSRPAAARRAPQLPAAEAQALLLDAAAELFYREGVRAVGIEAVVERAGVSKMSLYRRFASKDELVLAYLERRDARFFADLDASLAKHPGDARAQLLQYFEDLATRASRPEYRGCPFVNIACEFADRQHPARAFVTANKARLLARLVALAAEAGARDPETLARTLALVIEGVYASSQTHAHEGNPVGQAQSLARLAIDAACA